MWGIGQEKGSTQYLGHTGGSMPWVSISLDALQTVRRGFFFLLIGNKEKKNSSKLRLETFTLCRQQLSKGNETLTALHSKFFKECNCTSSYRFSESFLVVFEVGDRGSHYPHFSVRYPFHCLLRFFRYVLMKAELLRGLEIIDISKMSPWDNRFLFLFF